eukprot:8025547-Karenia_brevis.AAC.1
MSNAAPSHPHIDSQQNFGAPWPNFEIEYSFQCTTSAKEAKGQDLSEDARSNFASSDLEI